MTTATSGGSGDTETNEETVSPCTSSPLRTVTTVTPAGKWRMASRNCSEATARCRAFPRAFPRVFAPAFLPLLPLGVPDPAARRFAISRCPPQSGPGLGPASSASLLQQALLAHPALVQL